MFVQKRGWCCGVRLSYILEMQRDFEEEMYLLGLEDTFLTKFVKGRNRAF